MVHHVSREGLWRVVLPLAGVLIVGCTPGEGDDGGDDGGGPTLCDADFDCPVGNVCREKGEEEGDEQRECVPAEPTDERNFGKVAVNFAGDADEKHLLVVYSVPTAETAPNSIPVVTLVSDSGSPLPPPMPRRVVSEPLSADLQARFAFERRRRQAMDDLVSKLNAGDTTLHPATGRQANACAPACDASTMCVDGACVSTDIELKLSNGSTVKTDLVAVLDNGQGLQANVLVDQNNLGAQQPAKEAVEAFLSTLQWELDILGETGGHAGPLDRDGDGRITVAFTNAGPAGVVGYFDYFDFLPAGEQDATGNEMDILWARVPTPGEEAHATGTLAHEYAHLVSFARRVYERDNAALREVDWVDEGLAHLMEDLTGWGGSNVETVQAALDGWSDGGFALNPAPGSPQELVVRGQAYLLLRYLVDSGGATHAASSSTKTSATKIVSSLIKEEALGFKHSVFQDLPPDGLANWLQAVYVTGNPEVTHDDAKAAKTYLPVADHALKADTCTDCFVTGIDPWGTFDTAKGDTITLGGPYVEQLDEISSDPDAPLEPLLNTSGAVFYELEDFEPGEITITGTADANADVRMFVVRVK